MEKSEPRNFERFKQENNSSPVSIRLADQAISNKDFNKAIEILEKIKAEYPDYAALYLLLGRAYSGQENYKSALLNYKKGSELLSSEATYQFYLREIEHLKRQSEETEPIPSNTNVDFSSLLHTGNPVVSGVGEKDIEDNLISETLAKIYLTQGQTNEAIRVYQKLINKYPLKKLYFESRIKDITSL